MRISWAGLFGSFGGVVAGPGSKSVPSMVLVGFPVALGVSSPPRRTVTNATMPAISTSAEAQTTVRAKPGELSRSITGEG